MIIAAVIFFILMVIIAHVFAPKGYSWTRDTVSQLADIRNPYSWIIRSGMIVYGLVVTAAMIFSSFPLVLVAIYGAGVMIAGIFTVEKHQHIHMFSIYAAGAALAIAMVARAISGEAISIVCLASMLASELCFNYGPYLIGVE